MAVQLANPTFVAKLERLSKRLGVGKTAAVEAALDRMLAETDATPHEDTWAGLDAILVQLHRLPRRPDGFEAIEYDDNGLPR